MAGNKNRENRVSLLLMPDESESELYFWFNGNPFGLKRKDSALVAFDGQVYQTEAGSTEVEEVFQAMSEEVSQATGYLIAKQELMVAGVPTLYRNRVSFQLLNFFTGDKSIVRSVKDKNKKIAVTTDIIKRINRVRSAQGLFSTKFLPEPKLRLPPIAPIEAIDSVIEQAVA